ncbi:MAG: hypothetical protein IKI64_02070 [Clostridia bacterium]|nr:hypothetical protein [Clostridia bacterium]
MSKSREKLLIFSIIALVLAALAFLAYLLRAKIIKANQAPVITCASRELHVSVEATKEDLLTGVTAMDAEDGDLTDRVIVGSLSAFMDVGKCEVTYVVFDSGNKVATATRTIVYTDYHPPRFSLSDDMIFYSGDSVNPLNNITAYDCIDGNITGRISLAWLDDDGSNNTAEFTVINSMGDLSVLVVGIKRVDKPGSNTPVIKLNKYLEYIERGENIDPISYIKSISIGRSIYTVEEFGYENITYDLGDFDSLVPGTYSIMIHCMNGELVGDTELIVIVE